MSPIFPSGEVGVWPPGAYYQTLAFARGLRCSAFTHPDVIHQSSFEKEIMPTARVQALDVQFIIVIGDFPALPILIVPLVFDPIAIIRSRVSTRPEGSTKGIPQPEVAPPTV